MARLLTNVLTTTDLISEKDLSQFSDWLEKTKRELNSQNLPPLSFEVVLKNTVKPVISNNIQNGSQST